MIKDLIKYPDASFKEGDILLFSDGATINNGNKKKDEICIGGWGVWISDDNGNEIERISGKEEETTNNRMELMGVLSSLRFIEKLHINKSYNFFIISDSAYCLNCLYEYLNVWMKRGWTTATGAPIANQDLWTAINNALEAIELQNEHSILDICKNITLVKVKGHSGVPGNEMADSIASNCIR